MIHPDHLLRIIPVIEHLTRNIGNYGGHDHLASIAMLSKFHFSRTFKRVVGENLMHFIIRLKMEKAKYLMLVNPSLSVTDLAYQLSYNSQPSISASFSKYWGIAPCIFKQQMYSDLIQEVNKQKHLKITYLRTIDVSTQHLIYTKLFGTAYQPESMYAAYQNLKEALTMQSIETIRFIGIPNDYYLFTPSDKKHYDVCAVIQKPETKTGTKRFSTKSLEARSYMQFSFHGKIEETEYAWNYILAHLIGQNTRSLADCTRFEIYDPANQTDPELFNIHLYISEPKEPDN